MTYLGILLLLSTPSPPVKGASYFAPTQHVSSTHHQPNGNRIVSGHGPLPLTDPIDISLQAQPYWLVGAPFEGGAIWITASREGIVEAFKTTSSGWEQVSVMRDRLPPGMPPLLEVINDRPRLRVPPESASALTQPALTIPSQDFAFLTPAGELVIDRGARQVRLPINALPDARIVTDRQDRLALLTVPTTEYRHNVLGDALEAKAITLVSTRPEPTVLKQITIPDPWVIEGIAPIWVDLNQDGSRELVVTLSSPTDGGKIVVYNESGQRVAEGPGIGRGFRWRNQMAATHYGPNGEMELTAVRTPHIGGTLEYYRWEGQQLERIASLSGFTSHVIRSRNLDLNISGDFLGTGQPVIIIPNNQRDTLHCVRRTGTDAEIAFSLPTGGRLATNPAAVTLSNGDLALAIGSLDNRLRIWSPNRPITKLSVPVASADGELTAILFGEGGQFYQVETSSDLQTWTVDGIVAIPVGEDQTDVSFQSNSQSGTFFRVRQQLSGPRANIQRVTVAGETGRYTFSVQIASDETGCEQYADWWEIITEEGDLLYRRVLLHSHVNEQPFTRSGGPVFIPADQTVIVRAHLHPNGYVGTAMKGSALNGFTPIELSPGFARDLALLPPQPQTGDCPF